MRLSQKTPNELPPNRCPHGARQGRLRFFGGCPECRAADRRIAQGVAQIQETAVRVSMEAGRQRTLTAMQPLFFAASQPLGGSRSRWRPVKAAFAGGTAAFVIGGAAAYILLFSQGTPLRPTAVLADVESAMAQVHTVTWRETSGPSVGLGPNGEIIDRHIPPHVTTIWVRLDSPALVQLRTLSGHGVTLMRTVMLPNASYQIQSNTSSSGTKTQSIAVARYESGIPALPIFGPDTSQSPADRLRLTFLFQNPEGPDEAGRWSEHPSGKSGEEGVVRRDPWILRKATLPSAGPQELMRFDSALHYSHRLTTNEKGQSWIETGESWSFWVDPKTHRIVRREVRKHVEGFGKTVEFTRVSEGFQYDRTPPPGIFEVVPPIGQPFTVVPLPERKATPEEDSAIQALVRRSLDAWNRKDGKAYLACWDFDYLAHTADAAAHERRKWLQQMQTGIPYHTGHLQSNGAFFTAKSRITGIFVRRSPSDPFPPTQPCEFGITGLVETPDRPQGLALNFNIRRRGDDYRIVRLDAYPLKDPSAKNALEKALRQEAEQK